jgi:hypothetical protein
MNSLVSRITMNALTVLAGYAWRELIPNGGDMASHWHFNITLRPTLGEEELSS